MQATRAMAALAAAAILSACASTPPTEAELAAADYGPRPPNYKEIIHWYLQGSLRDPDSAQIRFANEPVKGWTKLAGKLRVGYAICVGVNAKNSFGAYTGYKDYYFVINRGKILQPVLHAGTDMGIVNRRAEAGCNRVVKTLPASAL